MELSVIENDPKEVKKYLQNFVPINYYRVLDDAYLYQIRAVLLHSVSHAELYNPVYAGLINDLTVTSGKNYATINTKLEVITDNFSALAIKTESVRVEAANANASIVEIQQASAEQNKAQASVNQRLEASLDDIVVGGRNIMKNSDFSKGYRAWQEASITKHNHFIGAMHKISSTGIVGSLMGIYPLAEYQNMAMVEGTEYSISFYAYGSILLMDEIYLTCASEAPIKLPSVVISTDLSERRHITFKAPTGGGGLGLIFGATATSEDDWFSISRVKVELGNKPTDWTPAPEDVDGYIAEVQSSIDTFKEVQVERNLATATSLERLDSRVKDNVASILTERNTRVDQHSAQATINTELYSETKSNKASIKSTEETFTTRYEAQSLKIETLEAESSEGRGKIENLESVTANLTGVVTSQGSTLTARLNNLNVGGRNLLRNSDFKIGVDNWGTATNNAAKSIFGNLVTVTNTGTNTNYFGLTPVEQFKAINIIKGKEYVLSFYTKGNVPLLNEIWITLGTHLPQKLGIVEIDENLDHRSELVFTANESTEVASIIIGTSGYAKDSWFSVAATKLELGNKATDWTKAPEDTEGRLIEINASIESFKEAQALENEATATRFDKMDTQYGDSFGSINEKYELVSNELGTTAQAILDLNSTTGSNSAIIKELKETTSTNSGSISSINSKLEVEYIPKVENIEANIKNAVKSTDVEYYLSTSTTAPVGGSWLTTAPPWTPSKFMFQRIKTTYVDGTIKHTPSDKGTNISGAKGDKGIDGVNGINGLEGPKGDKGIPGVNGVDGKSRFTHLAYSTSSAGANFSPSHFTTATYIGMYVDDVETDSTDRTKYKWSLIKGADGTNGTPGAKGTDGLTPFFHVAYATNATGTEGFSTSVSAGKTYIGQYTDNTLEDSTTPSKYKWTLIKGADGSDGAVGQGVDKIVEQYAVSNSKTVVPTSWGTVMPVWSYGLYVWTRSEITYKNPKEVAHTQPLVDSSWEAVNNINIGGRNLLRDSNVSVSNNVYEMKSYVLTEAPNAGDDIVITIWGTLGADRTVFAAYNSGGWVEIGFLKLVSPGVYRYVGKWVKGTASDTFLQIYQFTYANTSTSTINAIKLEKGNIGTEWSPAPEDNEIAISATLDIANKITNDFGKLKGETKVLTEIGGKISGWKNLSTETSSSFDILADNFSVGNAGVMKKPFSIVGNDIVFNGKVAFNSVTGTEVINKAVNDFNNLEIGGRNFLANSADVVFNGSDYGNAGLTIHATQGYKSITPKFNGNVYGYLRTTTQMDVGTYTMSMEVHSTHTTGMYFRIGGVNDYVIQIPNTGGKWQKITHTYTGTSREPNTQFLLGFASLQAGKTIHFRGLKVEKGNKATDWSAAPEDVEGMVKGIENNIYYPNTTTIDGGKIRTNSIHADRIEANTFTAAMINTDKLSAISSNLGDITGGSIKIGSNFNVTTAGVLTASSGNFTGVVNATSGSFKGSITASTINIADKFKVDSLGNMTATSGTFGGTVTGGNISIGSGNFTVDSLGNMTAYAGNFRGSITGASGTFSGDITGASGRFTGTVLANKIEGKVANIADLAVDTLQIAGNAVTIPVAVYTEGSIGMNTGYLTEVQRMTIPNIGGNKAVAISFNYTVNGTDQSSSTAYVNIALNGTVIRSGMVARTNTTSGGAYSTNLLLSPTESGVLTVSVIYSGNSRTGDISSRFISMVLTKR